jgi:hypothetical protein
VQDIVQDTLNLISDALSGAIALTPDTSPSASSSPGQTTTGYSGQIAAQGDLPSSQGTLQLTPATGPGNTTANNSSASDGGCD